MFSFEFCEIFKNTFFKEHLRTTASVSDIAVLHYAADSRTGVEDIHVKYTPSTGTYSIDDFNAKVMVVFLQQKQKWEAPQIKDLKYFITLGILDNYLEKTTSKKPIRPPDTYKTLRDTSPAPKSLLLHCKWEIIKPVSCMQVFDYRVAFTPMHLVFLELDTHRCHLDFKFLDENKNVIVPRTFYL